jgi:hypothetical protein
VNQKNLLSVTHVCLNSLESFLKAVLCAYTLSRPLGHRTDLFCGHNPVSLEYGIKLVRGEVAKGLNASGRPANLHFVNSHGSAQTEVDPQIILREVASTAVNFFCLCHSACHDLDPRVQCQAVALGSRELKAYPMAAWNPMILQNHRTPVEIADHDIQITVVEKIADRKAA